MVLVVHSNASREPSNSAELQVVVLDYDLELRRDATVEVAPRGSQRATRLDYDRYLSRYVAHFDPGEYELRVSLGKSMEVDERKVYLQAGKNTVYSFLAPLGTPFYYGPDREKIFFKPDKKHLLLYASGVDVTARLPGILKKRGIRCERVSERPLHPHSKARKVEASSDKLRRRKMESACYVIRNPPLDVVSPLDAWREMESELEQMEFRVRIAAPLHRGRDVVDGLTNELIVRFNPEVTQAQVEGIAKEYGCEAVHRILWIPNGYLMRTHGLPSYDLLELIDKFLRMPSVVYAEPNVIVHLEKDVLPSDYLYPEQTYLPVVHALQAWNRIDGILGAAMSAGSPNITVAVFDTEGVSPDHPDLTCTLSDGSSKMVANFDFINMTNQTVANLGGDHGTCCASVAAGGFNNAVGFAGVAGNCHLIGAYVSPYLPVLDLANAWMWAAGLPTGSTNPAFPASPSRPADVLSNSWGGGATWNNTIRDAFDYLTIYGRGGKGCVICFSVGNLGYVQFSVQRRYAAYFRTVAVGASISANPTNPTDSLDPDPASNTTNLPAVVDTRAYYSPYGPEMDLVAPAHTAFVAAGHGTADPVAGDKVDPIPAATLVGEGDWIGRATTATTLTAGVAAGATTLPISSSTGFAVGQKILIGLPGGVGREFSSIIAVGPNSLTVPGLARAHAAGTSVATGPSGYDRREFGATSHACPTVAGAAALVLSVRPELTWLQVRRILHENSDRIDTGQTNAIGRWVDQDGDGVAEFSQWYGFGRLNIDRAVEAAHNFDVRADIVVRDNLQDDGSVSSPPWWAASPDIWVSSADVPIPTIPYTTDPTVADPTLTNAVRGHPNYVFIRVKNVGQIASDMFYVRALITHYPGFEFRYPQEWMPSNAPGAAPPTPLTPGTYLIGEQAVNSLAADHDQILKFTWPANLIPPDLVTVAGVTTHWHPCVLAEVSPHDGPSPGPSGFPVQRDNNLAQRNITVSNTDSDDACAVVAGTSSDAGVESLILDRSFLESDAQVFVRIDQERTMRNWLDLVREQKLKSAQPFAWEEKAGGGRCSVTLLDAARLRVTCAGNRGMVIHAAAGTRFLPCQRESALKPRVSVGQIQGVEALFFESSADALELPLDLSPGKYVPIAIGFANAKRGSGTLRISQRLRNGEISSGYEIRR